MTDMKCGWVELFGLYSYAARNASKPRTGGAYKQRVKELLVDVPESGGWYVWGKFNDVGWWDTVYVGQTKKGGSSSLKDRLYQELYKDWHCIWGSVYGAESANRLHKKLFDYDEQTKVLRRRGCHYIVWCVSDIDDKEYIIKEESTLISVFRPSANIINRAFKPWSFSTTTPSIIRMIEEQIDRIRET